MEIEPETVCRIVFKVRELIVGDDLMAAYDAEEGPDNDGFRLDEETLDAEPHDEHEHDLTYNELKSFIDDLPDDKQCELVALAWLGRGDNTKEDWPETVKLATERHTGHTAEYLLGMPLLADYLEEALQKFDISCEDFEV